MGGEQENRQAEQQHEQLTAQEQAELEHGARERLEKNSEQSAERESPRHEKESAAEREATEQARSTSEHGHQGEQRHPSPAERRKDTPSRTERNQAYNRLMNDARQHMSPAGKSFSTFIHSPVIEKSSEAVGATIARPNAILAGSAVAFTLTLGVYLTARYFGYPLSGFETIAAFILGWIIGLAFDYFKAMATGSR